MKLSYTDVKYFMLFECSECAEFGVANLILFGNKAIKPRLGFQLSISCILIGGLFIVFNYWY